jgi:formate hydrogenlyase subunit 3/multisubunit Na+/H+ antiporter MnhD subunit
MNGDIISIIFPVISFALAIYLVIYVFSKRGKKDSKAFKAAYLLISLFVTFIAIWMVGSKFIGITDAVDNVFLYIGITLLVSLMATLFFAAATKKNKTPEEKKLFIFLVILLIIFLLLSCWLVLRIMT